MSRSYKKHPYGRQQDNFYKREANRRVRHKLNANFELVDCGKGYRKMYPSWEICEYKSYLPYHRYSRYWSEDKLWHKYYRRK